MGEFCQMTWTSQNLISSQNQQHVELKKLLYKKIFCTREHLKNKLFDYICFYKNSIPTTEILTEPHKNCPLP
jgi:hypothetical protein